MSQIRTFKKCRLLVQNPEDSNPIDLGQYIGRRFCRIVTLHGRNTFGLSGRKWCTHSSDSSLCKGGRAQGSRGGRGWGRTGCATASGAQGPTRAPGRPSGATRVIAVALRSRDWKEERKWARLGSSAPQASSPNLWGAARPPAGLQLFSRSGAGGPDAPASRPSLRAAGGWPGKTMEAPRSPGGRYPLWIPPKESHRGQRQDWTMEVSTWVVGTGKETRGGIALKGSRKPQLCVEE
ncbi:uncharacterized protein LOC116593478 [Mustela erminea]|uniref:uncharacterized protein LOC116593478 n=1 Tax=Mustela erminea TaxID=36723 RepID=UPI0013871005|nr:uncharacterized protein LOC116593478 [Mustela erminea]